MSLGRHLAATAIALAASFYRIHMALLGIVKPLPDGKSELRVSLAAGPQDSGPLADPVACGSSGKLEERLFDSVASQLQTR